MYHHLSSVHRVLGYINTDAVSVIVCTATTFHLQFIFKTTNQIQPMHKLKSAKLNIMENANLNIVDL